MESMYEEIYEVLKDMENSKEGSKPWNLFTFNKESCTVKQLTGRCQELESENKYLTEQLSLLNQEFNELCNSLKHSTQSSQMKISELSKENLSLKEENLLMTKNLQESTQHWMHYSEKLKNQIEKTKLKLEKGILQNNSLAKEYQHLSKWSQDLQERETQFASDKSHLFKELENASEALRQTKTELKKSLAKQKELESDNLRLLKDLSKSKSVNST